MRLHEKVSRKMLILFLVLFAGMGLEPTESTLVLEGAGDSRFGQKRQNNLQLPSGPSFDPSAPTNVTAQLGNDAFIDCKVRQLGSKSVSFIRKRDSHILTVDRLTFIGDERFVPVRPENSDTWTLQIRYVQRRDAGYYECQVGSEPKISRFIYLDVVVPQTSIFGEPEIFVKIGSTVHLKCVITKSLMEPSYIFWYHNTERILNLDNFDIQMKRVNSDTTMGILTIHHMRHADAGNFTCEPSNLPPATILIHPLTDEKTAAMQKDNASASSSNMTASGDALTAVTRSRNLRVLLCNLLIGCIISYF